MAYKVVKQNVKKKNKFQVPVAIVAPIPLTRHKYHLSRSCEDQRIFAIIPEWAGRGKKESP